MNYKDFSSPLVDEIREHGVCHSRRWLTGIDAAEDLRNLHFGQTWMYRKTYCCMLEKSSTPVGVAQGAFGTADDPALLYILLAFPVVNANYEIIAYRYNPDKFFVSRDGKLLGFIRGDFSQELDSVKNWEFYCGEELSGAVDLSAGWSDKETISVDFVDKQRELAFKIFAPPRFKDWKEKLLHNVSMGLWSPPLPPDPVLVGRTRFRSRSESEIYFCAFAFLRMMVCR